LAQEAPVRKRKTQKTAFFQENLWGEAIQGLGEILSGELLFRPPGANFIFFPSWEDKNTGPRLRTFAD
jgi:hypothetical protein